MAVLPGSSGDVPESGNDPSLGGVKWMEDVTEQGVRNRTYNQVFPSMQGAKNSLLGKLYRRYLWRVFEYLPWR